MVSTDDCCIISTAALLSVIYDSVIITMLREKVKLQKLMADAEAALLL